MTLEELGSIINKIVEITFQFFVDLYELEAKINFKLKEPLYDKRKKVINQKNEHGEPGIEGFWLHVSNYFLKLLL